MEAQINYQMKKKNTMFYLQNWDLCYVSKLNFFQYSDYNTKRGRSYIWQNILLSRRL